MNSLQELLNQIYSSDEASQIIESLSFQESQEIDNQPQWHKNMVSYSVYPFSFCTDHQCTLNQFTEKLDYLQTLGIDAIHVLPPFESPMIDNGFDVSNYYTIRKKIGGNDAFGELLTKASERNIRIFIDLILNHISQQHYWFQEAIAGNEYYRDFFHWQKEPPEFLEIVDKADGTYGRYIISGAKKDVYLVFPEHAGEVPHWRKGSDGNWYFHTFYPQQIDLNWSNPNVFVEMAKVVVHWGKRGVSFRLDAIQHLGKRWHEDYEDSAEGTIKYVQSLHHVAELKCPDSIFLIEANTHLETLKEYCGTTQHKASDLAYNFKLNEAIWTALILNDTDFLWETLEEGKDIPDWSQWVTFLRNHDALSLHYCSEKTKDQLCALLNNRGIMFQGGHSIAGRTASFLENDVEKIIMAHFLLISLPGSPSIIYGDEIGKQNDFDYMKEQTWLKKQRLGEEAPIKDDARDINRGYVTEKQINSETGKQIYQAIQAMIQVRSDFPKIALTTPTRIVLDDPTVFAARYELENETIDVYINLSNEEKEVTLNNPTNKIQSINSATVHDTTITLPPYAGVWVN